MAGRRTYATVSTALALFWGAWAVYISEYYRHRPFEDAGFIVVGIASGVLYELGELFLSNRAVGNYLRAGLVTPISLSVFFIGTCIFGIRDATSFVFGAWLISGWILGAAIARIIITGRLSRNVRPESRQSPELGQSISRYEEGRAVREKDGS